MSCHSNCPKLVNVYSKFLIRTYVQAFHYKLNFVCRFERVLYVFMFSFKDILSVPKTEVSPAVRLNISTQIVLSNCFFEQIK